MICGRTYSIAISCGRKEKMRWNSKCKILVFGFLCLYCAVCFLWVLISKLYSKRNHNCFNSGFRIFAFIICCEVIIQFLHRLRQSVCLHCRWNSGILLSFFIYLFSSSLQLIKLNIQRDNKSFPERFLVFIMRMIVFYILYSNLLLETNLLKFTLGS